MGDGAERDEGDSEVQDKDRDRRKDRTRDKRSGRYEQEYTDEQLLEAVEKLEMATTTEVADEVDGHHNNVRNRLRELEDEDEVIGKMKSRTLIWMPS